MILVAHVLYALTFLPRVVICRSEPVLHMLIFGQKRGNATFYEWRTGKEPTVIERLDREEAPPDAIADDAVGHITAYILELGTLTPYKYVNVAIH